MRIIMYPSLGESVRPPINQVSIMPSPVDITACLSSLHINIHILCHYMFMIFTTAKPILRRFLKATFLYVWNDSNQIMAKTQRRRCLSSDYRPDLNSTLWRDWNCSFQEQGETYKTIIIMWTIPNSRISWNPILSREFSNSLFSPCKQIALFFIGFFYSKFIKNEWLLV